MPILFISQRHKGTGKLMADVVTHLPPTQNNTRFLTSMKRAYDFIIKLDDVPQPQPQQDQPLHLDQPLPQDQPLPLDQLIPQDQPPDQPLPLDQPQKDQLLPLDQLIPQNQPVDQPQQNQPLPLDQPQQDQPLPLDQLIPQDQPLDQPQKDQPLDQPQQDQPLPLDQLIPQDQPLDQPQKDQPLPLDQLIPQDQPQKDQPLPLDQLIPQDQPTPTDQQIITLELFTIDSQAQQHVEPLPPRKRQTPLSTPRLPSTPGQGKRAPPSIQPELKKRQTTGKGATQAPPSTLAKKKKTKSCKCSRQTIYPYDKILERRMNGGKAAEVKVHWLPCSSW
ncbi:cell surface glycoprotein 1-like [Cyprinus carpio]|uniref:Cell surface glycoprotein 1-like n=1 Tax=Cyprinus carpio TaxID=7962 RepID=A0A9R0AU29_CYPCA|nr:cell surface glycoprotein 1-like [Cyprinus carpio]